MDQIILKKKILYVSLIDSIYSNKIDLFHQQRNSFFYKEKLALIFAVSFLLNNNLQLNESYYGIHLKSKKLNPLMFLLYTIFYVRKNKFDVVIVHGLDSFIEGALIGIFSSAKVMLQHHAEKTYLKKKAILMPLANKFIHGYFFNGVDVAKLFWEKRCISKHRVFAVTEATTEFKLLEKTFFNPERTIIFIGRLNENKNVMTFLKALYILKAVQKNFKAIIYYTTNELEGQLKQFSKEKGLDDVVEFKGKISNAEVEKTLNRADIFVSTSFYEGSGYALIEALACGVYPVVSNIPSFNFLLDGLDEKKQFDPTDEKQLAMQLADALNLNFTEEIRQKIRNHFEVKASANAIAMQIKNALMQL